MLKSIIRKINHWLNKINYWLNKPIDASLLKENLKRIGIIPQNIKIVPYFITVILILFLVGYYWLGFMFIGTIILLYILFKNRTLNEDMKIGILYLIIYFNYFFIVFIGYNISGEPQGWLIIFPILNIIFNTALLLASGVTEVSDKQFKKEEFFIEIIILTLIFVISQYIFNHHWAITFSICLLYSAVMVDFSEKIIIKNLLKR